MPNPTLPVACFAPPLTDELLARYESLIAGLSPEQAELQDALRQCLACVKAWWELPASGRKDGERFDIGHRGEKSSFRVTALESEHVTRLWDVTPWMRELLALEELFSALPTGTREVPVTVPITGRDGHPATRVETRVEVIDQAAYDLRNAAFHLLWHAKEITLDREPLTSDVLS